MSTSAKPVSTDIVRIDWKEPRNLFGFRVRFRSWPLRVEKTISVQMARVQLRPGLTAWTSLMTMKMASQSLRYPCELCKSQPLVTVVGTYARISESWRTRGSDKIMSSNIILSPHEEQSYSWFRHEISIYATTLLMENQICDIILCISYLIEARFCLQILQLKYFLLDNSGPSSQVFKNTDR